MASIASPKLGGKGPQYPALKVNVSVYQREVADIMEESIEEKRRESISQRPSKIKKRLSIHKNNHGTEGILQEDPENIKMVKVNMDELDEEAALLEKLN